MLTTFFAGYCRSDLQDLEGCPGACSKLHDFNDVKNLETKLLSKCNMMRDRCYELVLTFVAEVRFRCFRAFAKMYAQHRKFDQLKMLIKEGQREDYNDFDYIVEALEQRRGFSRLDAIKFLIASHIDAPNAVQSIERMITSAGSTR